LHFPDSCHPYCILAGQYLDFIYFDDQSYVTENYLVQKGITLEGIRWAFTTGHASNWHPLTWISHMLDVQLFGLQPRWHHLTNLLFHLVNTLLLFFVLHRMTKARWESVFVSALFALHPLHVESVAWVSERKDVLSTFFWMLTMGAYCLYVERPRIQRYLFVVLFFVLGLMSKPMLVTLPFILLLLDYWPLQRFPQKGSDHKIRTAVTMPIDTGNLPVLPLAPLPLQHTFASIFPFACLRTRVYLTEGLSTLTLATICRRWGIITERLRSTGQAIEDMKTAARLGYKDAQNTLRSQGIGC
jgi:hypothetical protein